MTSIGNRDYRSERARYRAERDRVLEETRRDIAAKMDRAEALAERLDELTITVPEMKELAALVRPFVKSLRTMTDIHAGPVSPITASHEGAK